MKTEELSKEDLIDLVMEIRSIVWSDNDCYPLSDLTMIHKFDLISRELLNAGLEGREP